jgi:hypothetical protein
MENPKSP